ncbi:MAG: 4a-hydroxytetrahydrobiopterin dehydratase [Candidatus Pacearchaeota archaeon]
MELLSISEINEKLLKLSDWNLEDNGKSIVKIMKFKNFNEVIDFVNEIKEIAEEEGHHPDLRIFDYNNLEIKLTTHSLKGLTQKDFNVAMKIDKLEK